MKPLVFRAANAVGVGRYLRHRNRQRLLVLMYHGVVEQALDPFCWHQLPVDAFREQMAWVRRHYSVLPLEQALDLQKRGELPERAAAITFDDGYENVLDVAGPVLAEHRLPAHVFLVTDLVGTPEVPWPDRVWLAVHHASIARVDLAPLGLGTLGLETSPRRAATLDVVLQTLKGRSAVEKDALITALEASLGVAKAQSPDDFRMATWEQVQDAAAQGLFTFGPHSRTHDILSQVGDEEVERQIAGSREDVERRLGTQPTAFAYPNGRPEDFDDRSKRAVEEAGFDWAFSTRLGLVGAEDDPLALPRIAVGADLPFVRFQLLCSGWL